MNKQSPTAILTADIHIPQSISYQPKCRMDNYWETFKKKISFIRDLQNEYCGIPVLDAGDLCNSIRLDPEVETWCIKNLPRPLITIPGNHELPGHNINLLYKSSLSVLEAGGVTVLKGPLYEKQIYQNITHKNRMVSVYGIPYGVDFTSIKPEDPNDINILLIHRMITKQDFSSKVETTGAGSLLKIMSKKGFDLIVPGHNHESFIQSYQNKRDSYALLVNPGSLMRSSAVQIEYQPRVFLWYSENNALEPIEIPIEKEAVSIEHIKNKNSEEKRMESFIEKINSDNLNEIDFRKNIDVFFSNMINKEVKKAVKQIIIEAMKDE